MKRSFVAALGLSLFLMAGNAHAVSFQFYVTSPLASSGHVCPEDEGGMVSDCPNDDVDSATFGNMDGRLTFAIDGLSVVAEETGSDARLFGDFNPTDRGGLGTAEGDGPAIGNPVDDGQAISFLFSEKVELFSATHFNDSDSKMFDDGGVDYLLIVDGGDPIEVAINSNGIEGFAGVSGMLFEFRSLAQGAGGEGFYVSALDVRPAIPEPGTALLLGLGFVGLGAARRRSA